MYSCFSSFDNIFEKVVKLESIILYPFIFVYIIIIPNPHAKPIMNLLSFCNTTQYIIKNV